MAGKKKVRTLGVPVAISMDRKVKRKAAADISMERYFILLRNFAPGSMVPSGAHVPLYKIQCAKWGALIQRGRMKIVGFMERWDKNGPGNHGGWNVASQGS